MEIGAAQVKELRDKTGAGMMDCKKALTETGGDMEKAVDVLRKKGLAAISKRSGRAAKEGLIRIKVSADGKKTALVELNCETDFVANNDKFRVFADKVLEIVYRNGEAAKESKEVIDLIGDIGASIGENIKIGRVKVLSTNGCFIPYIHLDNKLGVIVELSVDLDDAIRLTGKDVAMQVAAASPLCVKAEQAPADVLKKEREIFADQVKGKPANIVEKIVEGKIKKFLNQICLLEQPFIKDQEISVGQYLEKKSKETGKEIDVNGFVRVKIGEE
ncbi:MAG: elongation factor Ts [Candidatus Aureabacteria bacterium]|nr:elongation factor Ts [Candidatus Auribacterota bacterium]